MEFRPQQHSLKIDTRYRHHITSRKMSTLTMSAPQHHVAFHREFSWQEPRLHQAYRPQEESSKVALPSIRQAFPELQLQIQQDSPSRPTTTAGMSPATSPGYMYSTSSIKRRRVSAEDDREDEVSSKIPRLYESVQILSARHTSPPRQSWHETHSTVLKSVAPPPQTANVAESRSDSESRPTLPSLPHLTFDRRTGELPRMGSVSEEFSNESARRVSLVHSMSQRESLPQQELRSSSASYDYHSLHRGQSTAVGPSPSPYERTPFTSGQYSRPYHRDPYMRMGELGMSQGIENKQRKRRGNLPKETTDKLRAWFVGHLQHPYPTEDEKQDLMRQTGLQMNQISNWFINARRRQLPTMISNARAESDAMSSRDNDDRILPSTERDHYGAKRSVGHLSDGEGSLYDEELSHHTRPSHTQRGSI
ncbi:homeobox protein TGIF1 [Microdochium nivale]|nr:homeobox protein TGIF1 [Microdochium nivale]